MAQASLAPTPGFPPVQASRARASGRERRSSPLRHMAEEHHSKAVASVEPRPLRRNVITVFDWELTSLSEQMSHGRTFINSPDFAVHGTEGAKEVSLLGNSFPQSVHLQFDLRGSSYRLVLNPLQYYILAVEAKLCCGGHEMKSGAVQTNGHGPFGGETTLFSFERASPFGLALQKQNGFSASVRVTTVSAQGQLVQTVVQKPGILPAPSLAKNLQSALSSGNFADVTLKSEDGDTFPAHRQLLAMRSPVLARMFYGPMKEAQAGSASIMASSAAVRQLLKCIYTDEIDADAVELSGHEMLDLGTQYEVGRLVALTREQLFRTISVDCAAERYLLASRYSLEDLGKACEAVIRDNLAAVMQTKGWALITKDPLSMGALLKSGGKRRSEQQPTPQKLKRPRVGAEP